MSSTLREYKAFVNQDHFGVINTFLKQNGKKEINWTIDT